MNTSSLLSLGSVSAKNSAVQKIGRIARRTALGVALLGAAASASAGVNLTGLPVTITSSLNGVVEQKTIIVTGASMQINQPLFSWMIPGDSFKIVQYSTGQDHFEVALSGNHTFTSDDALTITYAVVQGTVFDGPHTALVRAYGAQGGLGVSLCGNEMAVQMHALDTISTGGGWQGFGAIIGVVSTVLPGAPVADTAPKIFATPFQMFNTFGMGTSFTPQVVAYDSDSFQVLSLVLWENGQVLDVQTFTTPFGGIATFGTMELTPGYHQFLVEISDGFDTSFATMTVIVF